MLVSTPGSTSSATAPIVHTGGLGRHELVNYLASSGLHRLTRLLMMKVA